MCQIYSKGNTSNTGDNMCYAIQPKRMGNFRGEQQKYDACGINKRR